MNARGGAAGVPAVIERGGHLHESKQLRHALAACRARSETAMLATVAGIDGSVYRGIGARMLVRADGSTVGAVSGGCLEADVVARFGETHALGRPALVTYDTRNGDDGVLGLGLGCQGLITLLLEPLSGPSLDRAIAWLDALASRRTPVRVATILETPVDSPRAVGDRVVLEDADAGLLDALQASGHLVSVELVRPPAPLVICGAGNDAIPVTRLAASLGWHVTVVDHRPDFATRERFPDADEVVVANVAADAGALARAVRLDAQTAAVCMAHSAIHDGACLHALLDAGVGYLGVLGPRRRTLELFSGRTGATELPPNVHAPVGLDLGAESPEEIALAIVAEVAAVRNGRRAGMLRDHPGPIHADRAAGLSALPRTAETVRPGR